MSQLEFEVELRVYPHRGVGILVVVGNVLLVLVWWIATELGALFQSKLLAGIIIALSLAPLPWIAIKAHKKWLARGEGKVMGRLRFFSDHLEYEDEQHHQHACPRAQLQLVKIESGGNEASDGVTALQLLGPGLPSGWLLGVELPTAWKSVDRHSIVSPSLMLSREAFWQVVDYFGLGEQVWPSARALTAHIAREQARQ